MIKKYVACWYGLNYPPLKGLRRRCLVGDVLRFDYVRHEGEGRSPDKLTYFMSGIPDPTGQYFVREEPFDRHNTMRLIWSSE